MALCTRRERIPYPRLGLGMGSAEAGSVPGGTATAAPYRGWLLLADAESLQQRARRRSFAPLRSREERLIWVETLEVLALPRYPSPMEHAFTPPHVYQFRVVVQGISPLEAMAVVARALERLLEADDQTTMRQVIGDAETFREAVAQLDAYIQFQRAYVDRRDVNTQLRSVGSQEGANREVDHPGRDHNRRGPA